MATIETRSQRLMFYVVTAVAVFAMASPGYLVWSGRVFTDGDLGQFFWPLRHFHGECVQKGLSPYWCPYIFGGFNLLGEGQHGLLHPLVVGLYSWLPTEIGYGFQCLYRYPMAWLGVYCVLRQHGLLRVSSAVGASAFAFSTFNLYHFGHLNAVEIIAHAPWNLWAICRILHANNRSELLTGAAALFVLTGSQMLLGYPQYLWFTFLAEISYILGWCFCHQNLPSRSSLLVTFAAKLFSHTAGAVQLLITSEALWLSYRSQPTQEFRGSFSLHPYNIIQLLQPDLLNLGYYGGPWDSNIPEFRAYPGAGWLILSLATLIAACAGRGPSISRRVVLYLSIVSVGLAILALGSHTPIFELTSRLPLIGNFRCSCRYTLLLQTVCAILAALEVEHLLQRSSESQTDFKLDTDRVYRWLWLLPIVAFLLGITAIAYANTSSNTKRTELLAQWELQLLGPVVLVMATLFLRSAARGRFWALGLLLSMAILEPAVRSVIVHKNQLQPQAAPNPPVAVSHSSNRIWSLEGGNAHLHTGWKSWGGYAALEPRRALPVNHNVTMQLAGVEWVLRETEWQKAPLVPFGRARLVTQVKVVADPENWLSHNDFDTTALCTTAVVALSGPPGEVKLRTDEPGDIGLVSETTASQILLLTERWDPNWTVSVDDQPAECLRVNGDFLGCVVPPGQHTVRFRYEPRLLPIGLALSAGACVAMLGFCVAVWFWKRPTIEPPTDAPSEPTA